MPKTPAMSSRMPSPGSVKALPKFELDRQRGRFRTWLWQMLPVGPGRLGARQRRRRARAEDAWLDRMGEPPMASEASSDAEWELGCIGAHPDLRGTRRRSGTGRGEKTWA